MRPTTRAWFASSFLMLVSAALLHAALPLTMALWAPLVHLTLFGWISGMIVAVNYHTMPVFTGRDFPHQAPIWAHLGAQVTGVALVAAGLLAQQPGLVSAGLGLELLAALLFVLNSAMLLAGPARRSPPPLPPSLSGQPELDRVATRATAASSLCLPLALSLLLAAQTGLVGGSWWLAAEHLAALGWVMLMIVGVAAHVLPRFSGRRTRGASWARAQLGVHLLALALILLGLGWGRASLFAAGGLAMAAALGLFAWLVWPTLQAVTASSQLIMPTVKESTR
jgi:hypothetical protein